MGHPQDCPLSPVLYSFYTRGLADLNSNGLKRVRTLADDGLIYKPASDTHTAVTAVQEQLGKTSVTMVPRDKVRNQSKQGANPVTWCTLNNKAVRRSNASSLHQRKSHRYFGIHFDRTLTYKMQVDSTKLRCKKGLSMLKAMVAKDIEQRHLFLLYQNVVLSVLHNGLGSTTLSHSQPVKLVRVQNEAMRVILKTATDTPIESMRYVVDLPPIPINMTQGWASQSASQCRAGSQEFTSRCC